MKHQNARRRVEHGIRPAALCLSFVVAAILGPRTVFGQGADRIRLTKGSSEAGEIQEMTPLEVTIARGSAGITKVPVNEISSIIFKGEPAQLTQARINARGGYQTAIERLGEIDRQAIDRDFVRQDVEFYEAYCTAKLALAGNGSIADAGRLVGSFVRNHRQNYHYLEAVEVLGDLLVAAGRFDMAVAQYAELAKAPWTEFKVRSAVLVGRALAAQGKHADAIRQFDSALADAGSAAETKSQRLAAILGKAVSLAETGGTDQAVKMIEEVIRDADPEDAALHALAYNALGRCYEQANRTKDALLAFLHVDVLYASQADAHAEALSRLAVLWESVGQEGRARDARQLLKERYSGSRWAK
jgi:tetratricopeptide (TPR) repeat protein